MPLLYTILYTLGFILLTPLFLYKMWKRGKYRENFFQRFGRYEPATRQRLTTKTGRRCWIQAVSVGEVNLALLLIPALRQRLPDTQIILTTTTSTGSALARERLPAAVELLYFPQDFPWTVRRAYDLIQPDFIVLMESELWPNHIWAAAKRGVPVYLVNARMSPQSFRHHRWGFFRSVFDKLTLVCAQSREDADNFIAAGVPRERVHLTGNMKYDASLPQAGMRTVDPADVLRQIGITSTRPTLVAGSTHPGEEQILFDLRAKFSDLFLVLVPRHVERTPEIVELAKRKQVKMALRSHVVTQPPTDAVSGDTAYNADVGRVTSRGETVSSPDCLLVNTTGELKWFYEIATVIFVGKSLAGMGGQNIVEAAASGHPVLFGPNMQNFKAITAEFVAAGAGVQVQDVYELEHAVRDLLREEKLRLKIVTAARRVIEANVGATQRNVDLIAAHL